MDRFHTFARDEILASYVENLYAATLSVLTANFAVVKLDATHLRVPASAGVGAAVIGIRGRPRWVEANVDRTHPGGAAGTYDVYVTAADQDVQSTPAPNTDDTNYAFGLWIGAAGTTPAILAGTLDIYRKVATCYWDGGQITQVDPIVNVTPGGLPAAGPAAQAALRKLGSGATDATAGNDSRVPTQPENDALQGTSGAPANGNRFVTDADPRNSNTRTPTDGTVTEAKLAVALDALIKQRAYYGDGSDGAFTLDGAATPAWATRAGSVYTMTRDCYCTNLTVNAGVTLIRAGFIVRCTGTYSNAGTDQANGGGWDSGGAGAPAGSIGGGTAAGKGNIAGVNAVNAQGGAGGAGGGGNAGGTVTRPIGGLRRSTEIVTGFTSAGLLTGGAGGGGSVDGTGALLGGGGGGGVLAIAAPIVVNTGAIQARGGAGQPNVGGGGSNPGGGGGGSVHIIAGSITNTGTIDANGGAAGTGTGTAGAGGANGNVIQVLG